MKTTIDIADSLLAKTRQVQQRERITLRALVEEGLSLALLRHEQRRRPFAWKPAVFKGTGLRDEFKDAGWERIRAAIYEGRGG